MRATIATDQRAILEIRLASRDEQNHFYFQRQKGPVRLWEFQCGFYADHYLTPDFEIHPNKNYEKTQVALNNRNGWTILEAKVDADTWYSITSLQAKKGRHSIQYQHATQGSLFFGTAHALKDFLDTYRNNLAIVGASDR